MAYSLGSGGDPGLVGYWIECQPWEQPILLQRNGGRSTFLPQYTLPRPSGVLLAGDWRLGAITMKGQGWFGFTCSHMRNLTPTGLMTYEQWRHHLNLPETKFSLEASPATLSTWRSCGREKYADLDYFGDETEHFPRLIWAHTTLILWFSIKCIKKRNRFTAKLAGCISQSITQL